MENGNQTLVECSSGIETTGATSLGMPALNNNYSQSVLGLFMFYSRSGVVCINPLHEIINEGIDS